MKYPMKEPEIKDRWIFDDFVELHCTPEKVWPWLAQMGNGRAGWYSHDWIDNLGKKSYDFVDESLVEIKKGQKIPLAVIEDFEINRFLTYRFNSRATMSYCIEKTGTGVRLWTRLRVDRAGTLFKLFLQAFHPFMQDKQFQEIKKRVER